MKTSDLRISIIGAGNVGGLAAMRIAEAGLGNVVLVDVIKNLAQAKAEDIKDAVSVFNKGSSILGTDDMSEIRDSKIIVVTAGIARKPGMSREDLLKINSKIVKEVASAIKKYALEAIVVIVSNPVDVMTYLMLKETGFDRNRVFGMGSSLDSGRFSTLITQRLNLKPGLVEAKVIGSHSNSMFPLVHLVKINKKRLSSFLSENDIADIVENTKNRGARIVELFGSGSAYFAPSAAIFNIVKSIVQDKNDIIPVSCLLNGEYDVKDVCIGIPAQIGKNGIKKIIELNLTDEERTAFLISASKVKEVVLALQ